MSFTPSAIRVRCRRFRSNPWAFRDDAALDPLATLHGRAIVVTSYRRNGRRLHNWQEAHRPGRDLEPIRLDELRRRKAAVMSRYRNCGLLTAPQLRTIEALWFAGLGLRELARREGVRPAAISSRLAGIHRVAPEFARWWRLKQTIR